MGSIISHQLQSNYHVSKVLNTSGIAEHLTIPSIEMGHHPKCQGRMIRVMDQEGTEYPPSQVSRKRMSYSMKKPRWLHPMLFKNLHVGAYHFLYIKIRD